MTQPPTTQPLSRMHATASRQSSLRGLPAAGPAVALPVALVARITRTIVARGRLSSAFVAALPWIAVLSVAWSCGECVGYISPRESRRGIAAGTHMGSVQTS